MSTENLVMKAGWFASRVYEGTDVLETGETALKIKVGSFRPKFVISAQVWKGDYTEPGQCVVDMTATDTVSGKVVPRDYREIKLFDKAGTAITPAAAGSTATYHYRVLLME